MKSEIIKHQFQFVYYIIALSVACIGFSVYQSRGEVLNPSHIFLGLAVFFWGLSTYSGFNFIQSNITAMSLTHSLNELINSGQDNELVIRQKKDEIKFDVLKGTDYFGSLEGRFYYAIIFFLFWHIINMVPEFVAKF